MTPAIDLAISLAAISFMIAWLLVIAWLDFGRPSHALTWSIAFGMFGVAWLMALLSAQNGPSVGVGLLLLALPACGTALTCFAFHQRGGHLEAWRPIAIAAGVGLIAAAALWAWTGSLGAAAMPYNLFNSIACWYASGALVGRRKGERAAERLTLYWLRGLAAVCLLLFVFRLDAMLRDTDDAPLIHLFVTVPILPAILTGIGLFTIFLLTADLADQSRRLAGTDMLTGLLNRRGFDEAALPLLESARRADRALCLTMIDIDRFKRVNDRFGHLAGDDVLRRFAACLARNAGPRDILARIGGEEFAWLLPDRDCAEAQRLLEDARGMIEQCPLDLPGDYRVTASFGLASPGAAVDAASLISKADGALYLAKSGGRNRVVVAD